MYRFRHLTYVLAMACVAAAPARAEVVFDNLQSGPPPNFSPTEWAGAAYYLSSIGGRGAARFTVTQASYALSSITLPISVQGNGGTTFRVRLAADAGGVPGTTLEVLSDGEDIWPVTYPLGSATQLFSSLHPTLVAGQSYWVVTELNALPPPNTVFRWHANGCGQELTFISDSDPGLPTDPWNGTPTASFVAFRVEGTPLSPVQEAVPVWPHDPSEGVRLSREAGTQSQQVAISDGAGGAIVAWEDTRAGNSNIYVQRVGSLGRTLWTCDGVQVTYHSAIQTTPALLPDGSGGAFLVWTDLRNGFNYKLYAQRIDANGIAQWAPEGIPICSGAGDQVHAVLVPDGQGGVIVAWSDTRILPVDVYAQRLSGNGALLWGGAGVPIGTGSGAQWVPQMVSDGSGGAIIAWRDFRNATDYDIYAQHVNASGSVLWTLNGVPVANAINDQTEVQLVPDDLGGAIAMWLDARNGINTFDIYAQRLNGLGSWRWGNGIAVVTRAGNQANVRAISDGAGGAFVTWQEPGSGLDVYVEHIRSGGTTAYAGGHWVAAGSYDELNACLSSDGAGGALIAWQELVGGNYDVRMARMDVQENMSWNFNQSVSNAPGSQQLPQIVSDGKGGAIVAWQDTRNGNIDLYCQRLEHFLYLGNPEPTPLGVSDVPNDQGGMVQVSWAASYLEVQVPGIIASYRVWRSVPPQAPGLQSPLGSLVVTTDPEVAVRTGEPLITQSSGGTQAWEFVGTVAANNSAIYQFQSPTAQSARPGSSPLTAFMIQAKHFIAPTPYFFSIPWVGTAVDNLAPGTPTGLSAVYGIGAVELRWHPNPEPDIDEYRIYRGTTQDFPVGPASFFIAASDTDYVGPTDRSYVYKVTAVDIHGNESLWAVVAPWQTGIETPLPVRFTMSSPTPNPARDIATIRWSLPESGLVRLYLYDLEGRRVKVLEEGPTQAGDHVRPIPLRDDSGRTLASGLYFLRLDWNGETRVQRIAVVR